MSDLELSPSNETREGLNYEETVRGHVHYEITRRNLQQYVKDVDPMEVLYTGAGAAVEAIRMAYLRHEVTVVEPSEEKANRIAAVRSRLVKNVGRRITLLNQPIEDVLENFKYVQKFDMLMSHCAARQLLHPTELIDNMACSLRKGGWLSIVERGYPAAENQRTIDDDGAQVYAFKEPELRSAIELNGLKVKKFVGVRLISDNDYRDIKQVDRDELVGIVNEEDSLGHTKYKAAEGQFLHFIARKPTM
ncbi:MAG: hypothetical protein JWO35_834 [Candidatus Saccharibacteria bacterium]|nr:hypothetical protein [Candidatus Saccharibacteria bacterium]